MIRRICLVVLLTLGCNPSAGGGIPGYYHVLSRSSCDIGALESRGTSNGADTIVGSKGVFSTQVASGSAVALPNDPLPNLSGDVFPGGADQQNALVASYFERAGLPSGQVSSVTADEAGVTAINSQAADVLVNPCVAVWFSILHRAFKGTPIADSFAWSILGESGNSLEEQVHWPTIDQSVLDELSTFASVLSDPVKGPAFLASVPQEVSDGQLVIHHTGWSWRGPFQARACYRGTLSGANAYFDMTGHLVQLPDELGP
jgi:hypothetical protein